MNKEFKTKKAIRFDLGGYDSSTRTTFTMVYQSEDDYNIYFKKY